MIKNLTLQLNEAGKIKIGKKGAMITSSQGKEFRPPEKLNHFQLVTTEKDSSGDFMIDNALEDRIKDAKTGLVNDAGNLTGIPIRLLYNDTELNFPTRLASYVSGKLSCTGDGETSTKRIDDFTKQYPCPCPRFEQGYDGKDKCKAMGTLSCIIDEAGLFGQAHKFRTTSINSVKGILGGLELINTATNGRIAGLPLMLTMNAKSTITPQGHNTLVYVVSICYRGSMSDLRDEVLNVMKKEQQYLIGMDKLEAEARLALTEKPMISEDEQLEIAEEFFPESIDSPPEAPEVKLEPETTQNQKPELKTVTHAEPPEEEDPPGEPPVGTYKNIYNRLCEEKDYEKAMALAKRLTKNNLVYWLTNKHPEITIPEGTKKPELLDLCEEAMVDLVGETGNLSTTDINQHPDYVRIKAESDRKAFLDIVCEFFKPIPVDRTATRDILLDRVRSEILKREMSKIPTDPTPKPKIEEAKPEQNTEEPKIEPPPEVKDPVNNHDKKKWDESGLIEKDQLREIVKLKNDLTLLGFLDPTHPEMWQDLYISPFLDKDNNSLSSAVKMTKTQGNTLIEKIKKTIAEDDLPF